MINAIPFIDFGGEGPILHFAHPNAYPPGCFRQFIEPFLPHYRVLAVEHRPLWPGTTPEEMDDWRLIADDLIRFFEQQALEQVIGMGHSLGAVATIYAAVKRPSLFSRLILIDPVILPPEILDLVAENPEAGAFHPMVGRALKRRNRWNSRQAAFDRFRRKSVFSRWSDEALWDYVNYATELDETGKPRLRFPREWEARFYAAPPQVWDDIAQIRQPTLAIRAAESNTLFPEAWQLWQEVQPDAAFIEIPDAGHMLTMERPSFVAQTILNYLQNNTDH